jgi:hypothetical protein
MGRICVTIPDEVEKKVRVKVAEKHLGKKGALGQVVSEALELWLKSDP